MTALCVIDYNIVKLDQFFVVCCIHENIFYLFFCAFTFTWGELAVSSFRAAIECSKLSGIVHKILCCTIQILYYIFSTVAELLYKVDRKTWIEILC